MEQHFTLSLGGVALGYTVHIPTIPWVFTPFLTEEQQKTEVAVSAYELDAARAVYPPESTDAYVEYMELCPRTSDALLPYKRCIFHGTAFLWRDKAWIFTGPSGTGKTTQYVLWKILYHQKLEILNGDKPLLDFSGDTIWVRPSPWMGKEGMRQMKSAPLGGIILLRQGQENTIRRLSPREAVLPLYYQFMYSAACEEQARRVSALEQQLLTKVPVWELVNLGDQDSARLCHDTLSRYLEQEDVK